MKDKCAMCKKEFETEEDYIKLFTEEQMREYERLYR